MTHRLNRPPAISTEGCAKEYVVVNEDRGFVEKNKLASCRNTPVVSQGHNPPPSTVGTTSANKKTDDEDDDDDEDDEEDEVEHPVLIHHKEPSKVFPKVEIQPDAAKKSNEKLPEGIHHQSPPQQQHQSPQQQHQSPQQQQQPKQASPHEDLVSANDNLDANFCQSPLYSAESYNEAITPSPWPIPAHTKPKEEPKLASPEPEVTVIKRGKDSSKLKPAKEEEDRPRKENKKDKSAHKKKATPEGSRVMVAAPMKSRPFLNLSNRLRKLRHNDQPPAPPPAPPALVPSRAALHVPPPQLSSPAPVLVLKKKKKKAKKPSQRQKPQSISKINVEKAKQRVQSKSSKQKVAVDGEDAFPLEGSSRMAIEDEGDDGEQDDLAEVYKIPQAPRPEVKLVKNFDNNGKLFFGATPFWKHKSVTRKTPIPEQEKAILGKFVMEMGADIEAIPGLPEPENMNPLGRLEKMKKRDTKYFNSDRLQKNTIRSICNLCYNGPDDEEDMYRQPLPSLRPLNITEPISATTYPRCFSMQKEYKSQPFTKSNIGVLTKKVSKAPETKFVGASNSGSSSSASISLKENILSNRTKKKGGKTNGKKK